MAFSVVNPDKRQALRIPMEIKIKELLGVKIPCLNTLKIRRNSYQARKWYLLELKRKKKEPI
ncbi:Cytochrome c proximal [Carabus blaptoides fortunei]